MSSGHALAAATFATAPSTAHELAGLQPVQCTGADPFRPRELTFAIRHPEKSPDVGKTCMVPPMPVITLHLSACSQRQAACRKAQSDGYRSVSHSLVLNNLDTAALSAIRAGSLLVPGGYPEAWAKEVGAPFPPQEHAAPPTSSSTIALASTDTNAMLASSAPDADTDAQPVLDTARSASGSGHRCSSRTAPQKDPSASMQGGTQAASGPTEQPSSAVVSRSIKRRHAITDVLATASAAPPPTPRATRASVLTGLSQNSLAAQVPKKFEGNSMAKTSLSRGLAGTPLHAPRQPRVVGAGRERSTLFGRVRKCHRTCIDQALIA
jgi:hypothetical protein